MADNEEQNQPFLQSNSPRSNRRALSIVQRLRRLGRQCLAFVFSFLMRVYEFLNDDDNHTYRQRTVSTTETSQRLIDDSDTEAVMENNGQNPVDNLLLDENIEFGGFDDQLLRDSRLRVIQNNSLATGPILMITTSAQTTPVLSPTYSNSSPQRSPFHTDSPMPLALSYAGETVDRVKEISQQIHNAISRPDSPPPVFFAPNFQDELAQVDAMEFLQNIYRQAAVVVVFLSPAYPDSRFCREEWRTIKDRFFGGLKHQQQHEKKRLVLVKLGDYNSNALGLVENDFYVDGTKQNDKEVADIIISRFHKVEKLPIQ